MGRIRGGGKGVEKEGGGREEFEEGGLEEEELELKVGGASFAVG